MSSGQKTLFKKITFCNILPFLGLTSNVFFSVICPCRIIFNTIFENYKEKSFQKMVFDFVSCFWKWSQNAFKKTIFDVFCQFFGPTFKCNFLSHLLMLFCEVVGARRAPNEGPKGPPMPSAGARRRGPQGPELRCMAWARVQEEQHDLKK